MAGAGVPVPSGDDGAIVVALQACFEIELHENGVAAVYYNCSGSPSVELASGPLGRNAATQRHACVGVSLSILCYWVRSPRDPVLGWGVCNDERREYPFELGVEPAGYN